MAAAYILEVVEQFILGDESFEDDFQDFALEHCAIFDDNEVTKAMVAPFPFFPTPIYFHISSNTRKVPLPFLISVPTLCVC